MQGMHVKLHFQTFGRFKDKHYDLICGDEICHMSSYYFGSLLQQALMTNFEDINKRNIPNKVKKD